MLQINRIKIVIILQILILLPFTITGLRCYTCTYIESTGDKSCITNPEAVVGSKITTCSKKYCTIQRQETLDRKIVSFLRGCEDKPLKLNGVVTDTSHSTYFRSCLSDLCNSGNGLSSGSAADPNAGAGENMFVKGKSNANSIQHSSFILFFGIIFKFIVFP